MPTPARATLTAYEPPKRPGQPPGGARKTGAGRTTGHIQAMRGDGSVVAAWGLLDVVPVRWTGPSLNPDSPKVATETLEIAHHGFLQTGGQ